MSVLERITLIHTHETVQVLSPHKALHPESLVVDPASRRFADTKSESHGHTYDMLQKIVSIFHTKGIHQYLVYGKDEKAATTPFRWEVVPYKKSSCIPGSRMLPQMNVLRKVSFGAATVPAQKVGAKASHYSELLKKPFVDGEVQRIEHKAKDSASTKKDPFCTDSVITNQTVIQGNKVNVLYDRKPIGFGGERLHFLIVPKAHRTSFDQVTREEYVEAATRAQELITHFFARKQKNQAEAAYMFHKTGPDAGQTVPHWHMHVIFTLSKTQDICSKLTVFRNIALGGLQNIPLIGRVIGWCFGMPFMKNEEFAKRVVELKRELNPKAQ